MAKTDEKAFISLIAFRRKASTAAVFFVHGFTGSAVETWGKFPELLEGDLPLAGHDFFFWRYVSRKPGGIPGLNWLIKRFWKDDPTIPRLGEALRTPLENTRGLANQEYEKIIVVAHSMGGLIVQAFLLDELRKGRRSVLDRLTEVLFYATPSNGAELSKIGQFFQTQAADMLRDGQFIRELRSRWARDVEAHRDDPQRLTRFRLSLIAGASDKFVPPESSSLPFPKDEHEIVQGDHIESTKPNDRDHDIYAVLRTRLLRGTRTLHEQQIVDGEAPEVAAFRTQIEAARVLKDGDKLCALAGNLAGSPVKLSPALWKQVGLALSGANRFPESVTALEEYFKMRGTPDTDGRAAQQLAVTYSYDKRSTDAVSLLMQLPKEIYDDPETQGILGGCFKRQWLSTGEPADLGEKARSFYQTGYDRAKKTGNRASLIYNGINLAYMALALDKTGHREIAAELLPVLAANDKPDYWERATHAEALLLH